VAAVARAKVAAMAPGRPQSDRLTPKRLVSIDGNVLDVSPSGLYVVAFEGPDLVLRGIQTGQRTVLVAGFSPLAPPRAVFSPDGRRVAYSIRANSPTASVLEVIGVETGARANRLAGPEGDLGAATTIGWSSDGKSVLVEMNGPAPSPVQSLAWVSVQDGTIRRIRSFGQRRGMSLPRVSPDGHFLAYSSISGASGESPTGPNAPRRLFVASLDGTGETEVVQMAGSHTDPVWTPDGSHLLFVSDRSGARALWSLPLQGGTAVDFPSIVQAGFTYTPVTVSQSGTLYYSEFKPRQTVTYIAERGAAGGRVVTSFPGGGGDWSPDGRSFAFKPALSEGSEIIVRSMETGKEQSYRHENIGPASPHWIGNSAFLIQVQVEGKGNTVQLVDVATGTFRLLYPVQADGITRRQLAVPDDGARIFSFYQKVGEAVTGVVAVDPATGANGPIARFSAPVQSQTLGIDVTPDGTSIVAMPVLAGRARLLTIRSDGTDYREVGSPFPAARSADLVRWTPDGQHILYVSTENNRSRVMRIPAAGGTPVFEGIEVTGNIWNIDPSPNGHLLAYSADVSVRTDIWAIDNVLLALLPR
jgi:Tol biopolymer transport system component